MLDAPASLDQGRYRLVSRLGQGGMAQVWKAWDGRLAVWRAVKLLEVPSQSGRARFENEARTMARLHHPNIVAVHDVGVDTGRLFIVMDLAHGSLMDRVAVDGPLAPRVAVRICIDVLDALQHAHDNGVIHRDIKPHNILLGTRGRPLVADFGIARIASVDMTRTGAAVGTLAYMAPEQRSNAREVDGRADVYAAGGTLYALLTDREPLDLYLDRPGAWAGVPELLVPVLRRALAYEADARYASARHFADALQQVVGELPGPDETLAVTTIESPPPESASSRSAPGRPWGLVAAAALTVGLVVTVAVGGYNLAPEADPQWDFRTLWATEGDVQLLGTAPIGPDGTVYASSGRQVFAIDPKVGRPQTFAAAPGILVGFEADRGALLIAPSFGSSPMSAVAAGGPAEQLGWPLSLIAVGGPRGHLGGVLADNTVAYGKLDAPKPAELGALHLGDAPLDVCVAPDGGFVAVTTYGGTPSTTLFPVPKGSPRAVLSDDSLVSALRTSAVGCPANDRLWITEFENGISSIVELRLRADLTAEDTPARLIHRFDDGYSPFGIAFSADRQSATILADRQDYEILVLDRDGATLQTIPLPDRGAPRFAPDGSLWIASESGARVTIQRDGLPPESREMIAGSQLLGVFADERTIALESGRVVEHRGDVATTLMDTDLSAIADCGSAGGVPVCAVVTANGLRSRISVIDVDARTVSTHDLAFSAGTAPDPLQTAVAVSPDGKSAALALGVTTWYRIDLATGAATPADSGGGLVQSIGFTPEGHVVHTSMNDDGAVIDADTGRDVFRRGGWTARLRVDPLSGRIAVLHAIDHGYVLIGEAR